MDGEARSERLEEENKSGGDDLDSFRLLFLRGAWAVMAVVGGGLRRTREEGSGDRTYRCLHRI